MQPASVSVAASACPCRVNWASVAEVPPVKSRFAVVSPLNTPRRRKPSMLVVLKSVSAGVAAMALRPDDYSGGIKHNRITSVSQFSGNGQQRARIGFNGKGGSHSNQRGGGVGTERG